MTCLHSEDGKLIVCGVRRKSGYYFTPNRRQVLYCDSLWYGPTEKERRKKFERIDLFVARVVKKLGFMPYTFAGWWQRVAVPQLKQVTP